MTLGKLIANARRDKGLTLRELEAKTGVSNALINQIERGRVRDPGFRTVARIARALKLSLRLLAEAEAEPPG